MTSTTHLRTRSGAAQFAVDGQIEKGKITEISSQF
jgi:hypothetical protein